MLILSLYQYHSAKNTTEETKEVLVGQRNYEYWYRFIGLIIGSDEEETYGTIMNITFENFVEYKEKMIYN